MFAIIAYRIQADRLGDLDHETGQVLDRTDAKDTGAKMSARLVSFDQSLTMLPSEHTLADAPFHLPDPVLPLSRPLAYSRPHPLPVAVPRPCRSNKAPRSVVKPSPTYQSMTRGSRARANVRRVKMDREKGRAAARSIPSPTRSKSNCCFSDHRNGRAHRHVRGRVDIEILRGGAETIVRVTDTGSGISE
jgi:hypothetical protein